MNSEKKKWKFELLIYWVNLKYLGYEQDTFNQNSKNQFGKSTYIVDFTGFQNMLD